MDRLRQSYIPRKGMTLKNPMIETKYMSLHTEQVCSLMVTTVIQSRLDRSSSFRQVKFITSKSFHQILQYGYSSMVQAAESQLPNHSLKRTQAVARAAQLHSFAASAAKQLSLQTAILARMLGSLNGSVAFFHTSVAVAATSSV